MEEAPVGPTSEELAEVVELSQLPLLHEGGVGPWSLGMTPTQVFIQPECKPFIPLQALNGIECPNFETPLGTRTITFLFAEDSLSKVQVTIFEGEAVDAWAAETARAVEELGELYEMELATLEESLRGGGEALSSWLVEEVSGGLPVALSIPIEVGVAGKVWLSSVFNPRGGGQGMVYLYLSE